jgi:hypothetical protein
MANILLLGVWTTQYSLCYIPWINRGNMTPEREGPEQNHISFEEVISNATEIMLRDGEHVPVVIMEASNNIVVGQIPEMPATHGERVELMRFLGQAAAKSGRVDQLQQVFMISEGWMSEPTKDKPTDMSPSQDPNRKEVLIISAIQKRKHEKRLKLFEILRGSNEKVVGLKEILPEEDKKDESVEIPLLEAFVHGFQIAFRTKFN